MEVRVRYPEIRKCILISSIIKEGHPLYLVRINTCIRIAVSTQVQLDFRHFLKHFCCFSFKWESCFLHNPF